MNQVAAVVYARFHRKQMPDGRAVFGTFTRDYRNDALTCQVLITVPQCLEILMMSPKRQDWVAKMRYVIFDEVRTKNIILSITKSLTQRKRYSKTCLHVLPRKYLLFIGVYIVIMVHLYCPIPRPIPTLIPKKCAEYQ